jgi:hypothetical protein
MNSTMGTKRADTYADHIARAKRWIELSVNGADHSAVSYCALELRFAVERFCLEMLVAYGGPSVDETERIRSFDFVRNRIYGLLGHQRRIDRHFEFARILLRCLSVEDSLPTPNIGDLHRLWHDCSELLHVTWPLAAALEERSGEQAVATLLAGVAYLSSFATALKWPVLQTDATSGLARKFIDEELTAEEVESEIRRIGLYAVEQRGNAAARFVGKAVPPS